MSSHEVRLSSHSSNWPTKNRIKKPPLNCSFPNSPQVSPMRTLDRTGNCTSKWILESKLEIKSLAHNMFTIVTWHAYTCHRQANNRSLLHVKYSVVMLTLFDTRNHKWIETSDAKLELRPQVLGCFRATNGKSGVTHCLAGSMYFALLCTSALGSSWKSEHVTSPSKL